MEQKTGFEKWYVALALTIATVAVSVVRALQGGEIVVHRNFAGEPDRIGSSWEMLVIGGVAVLMFLVFRYAERHPEVGKMNVHPKVKTEGYRMLANMNSNTNLAASALLLYVALCMAGWVPFVKVLLLVFVILMIALIALTSYRVRQLNARALKSDDSEDATLTMMEQKTERLMNSRTSVKTFLLIPYLVLAVIFVVQLFSTIATTTQTERICYAAIAVTTAVCAVLAYLISYKSSQGEMFSLANARRMNGIGIVFAVLGALSFVAGVFIKQPALMLIGLLCFVMQYIVMLFVGVFVRSVRMKNEQDLTI